MPTTPPPPPVCVPCQVAIWDRMASAKLDFVTRMAERVMDGATGTAWPGKDWGKEWYETVEEFCGKMDGLLSKVTGLPPVPAPGTPPK